jgi:NADH-quinone oxidoreductase subunit M
MQNAWLPLTLIAIASILLGPLCATAQRDLRQTTAYVNVAQAGFVLLGASTLTTAGIGGAVLMLVAQGLSSAGLAFVAGVIERRLGHADLDRTGGLWKSMPDGSRLIALFAFAAMALPGTCVFAGQLMVLLGVFVAGHSGPLASVGSPATFYVLGSIASLGLLLSAACMLRTLQGVCFGPARADDQAPKDLNSDESLVLWTLGAFTIAVGILPWPMVLMLSKTALAALTKLWGG